MGPPKFNAIYVYTVIVLYIVNVSVRVNIIYSLTVGVFITKHPKDKLPSVSDNVTFTCEASGSPPISYRWLYNGNYIMDDPGHIEGANTDTLMIINVLVTDWGMYSCETTNIVNKATSNEATLYSECVCTYKHIAT